MGALSWNTGLNFLARISGVGANPLLDMREHLWLTLSKVDMPEIPWQTVDEGIEGWGMQAC